MSSNTGIPAGLAPIGGWQSGDGPASPALAPSPPAPPTSASVQPAVTVPPAAPRPAMGAIGAEPAAMTPAAMTPPPLAPPTLTPAPGSGTPSRFDTPAAAGAPRSRFDIPPPPSAPTAGPAAPGSRFAAPAPPTSATPPVPVLAAASVPDRDRAYHVAGAYRRGEVAPMGAGRMTAGIVTGVVVGGIVTVAWIVLYFTTIFYWFMLLGAGMGFVVGWSVFKATGEGEETTCWISCIISTTYAILGVGVINYAYFRLVGIPDIFGIVFGIAAIAAASERGFRTPEVLAVETSL